MKGESWFSRGMFQFLVELRFNNERAWFQANKARYEGLLKRPMLRFIQALAPRLRRVNPAMLADARSLFRIYRDTRFAKDKTPYKTHLAAQFRHRAESSNVHAPGFYLHLEPGECHAAAGIWMPDSEPLRRIRKFIAARPGEWSRFSKWPLWGDSLKRPPRGFDPGHRFIADLKRRHFITWVDFKDAEALRPDFAARVAGAFRRMDPLVRFLCRALGIRG